MELAAFASFAVLVVAWLIAPTKGEVVHIESVKKPAEAAQAA
ncbi:MAG TPA: hypothetical protein VI056_07480 [Candidatus Limnocylindria bacterium]